MNDPMYDYAPGSRLAVLQLRGPIYPDWSGAWFSEAARQCAIDPNAAAACVVIDSPGGDVRGANDFVASLKALAAAKPLYVVTSGMMASLAYIGGCVAQEIAVTATARVGSIGVRGGTYYDTSERMAKEGVKVHTVVSDAGKIPLGTPGVPITDEMLQPERDMVAAINAEFVGHVAASRRMSTQAVQSLHAAVYAGRDAVRVGLADRIVDSTTDYINQLAAKYPAALSMTSQPGRVPGNIAATAAGALLMTETSTTASATAETAAASATPAQTTVPPVVASAPAGPVPATIAELAAAIDDKAFCFDALTKGLTLVQAQAEYIKALKAAKPATIVAAAPAADPVETGARPSGKPEAPIAMTKANEYLAACKAGGDPIALGGEMFKGMNTGAIAGVKRPEVFRSPEQQYAAR